MANANALKYGAWVLVVFSVFCYPTVLFLAVLSKLYEAVIGKSKCKIITGDIAVVTGGACGLGKAISIELAKQGCHIAIADVNFEEATKTSKFIKETYNVKSQAYKVDISKYDEIVTLNEKVNTDLGTPTLLINNAAIVMFKNLYKPDPIEIERMINVNITSNFLTNRVFLPKMKELRKGHIVAIGSASSLFPLIYNAEYTSTKCALRGLMRVLRLELIAQNLHKHIHTTTVLPMFLEANEDVVRVMKKNGFDKIYPLISPKDAAERIVEAMLKDEKEIIIPQFFGIFYRMLESLPAEWQDWLMSTPMLVAIKGTKYHKEILQNQSN